MSLSVPAIREPNRVGSGVDRTVLEQLACLLPVWAADSPQRYRTLASYSKYCSDQHLSALPISQDLVREYLQHIVLRGEVSPWTARIVLDHIKDAFLDMVAIVKGDDKWDEALFEPLLTTHAQEWERSERDRLARLDVEDIVPALVVQSEDEAPDSDADAHAKRVLRMRKPKTDLIIQTRRGVGLKRTASYQNMHPAKRQRFDSPGPLSPLSAPDNVLFGSQVRSNTVHPLTRNRKRRDSDDSLTSVQPSSPLTRTFEVATSPPDESLLAPPRSTEDESDGSSGIDYETYERSKEDEGQQYSSPPSPVSSSNAELKLPPNAQAVDYIPLDVETSKQDIAQRHESRQPRRVRNVFCVISTGSISSEQTMPQSRHRHAAPRPPRPMRGSSVELETLMPTALPTQHIVRAGPQPMPMMLPMPIGMPGGHTPYPPLLSRLRPPPMAHKKSSAEDYVAFDISADEAIEISSTDERD